MTNEAEYNDVVKDLSNYLKEKIKKIIFYIPSYTRLIIKY